MDIEKKSNKGIIGLVVILVFLCLFVVYSHSNTEPNETNNNSDKPIATSNFKYDFNFVFFHKQF